ncbi:MAG: gliding motility-associated C-terminal domain-containing protein [Bacteroidales bacterium]|nr:gliding motility-associated C-terminal domain-containing protein [Bacteroidales bacterium]
MNIFRKHSTKQYRERILFLLLLLFVPGFFAPVMAEDYYWVGGSGNWSDINHWATTSGGSVLHAQIPTPGDDVFFDGNSFTETGQVVVVNQKNAVCRNMDWTGVTNNPILSGNDTTSLRIYGNLKFVEAMNQQFDGEFMFESVATGKTIQTSGHQFRNNVRFLGIGGGWTLQDDFNVAANIYFIHGSLETNNYRITGGDFISTGPNNRSILLSNSELNLLSWQINGQNLDLQAATAVFNIENLLSNTDGTDLVYGDIDFYGFSGSVVNTDVYVTYNNISFAFDGSVSGDCKINTVTTVGRGSITDSDSINQVIFNAGGSLSGGHHVVGSFIGKGNSVIEGNNEIGVALLYAPAVISGTNSIDSARFFQSGVITEANQIRKLIISFQSVIDGSNQIVDAVLFGDGYFAGSNVFDTLTLSPGNTYTFAIQDRQTIEDELNITGDCYKPIRMLSDTNGVQAIIRCNFPVSGDYLSLRDLRAEGATPFVATNSVDLGNNTGWNIETSTGLDLYWVNGQGNWDDPGHWDLSSGGPGGHCPPTEIDNALFDASSFSASGQIVNVNVKNAVCRDMKWENVSGPRIMGADTNNIRIYGSLTLSPQMQWMFLGQTFFEATEKGKTLTSAGNTFLNDLWFNGRGGAWSLSDDLTTITWIRFQQGEVYTLGNDLKCAVFSSIDTTTRKLSLSTSTVRMTSAVQSVWNLNGMNLELHADSSLLIAENILAEIRSFGGQNELVYNNVEFYGPDSKLLSNVYCNYNLVTFYDSLGEVVRDCTIDTVTFHGSKGTVFDSDIIKTAIFYEDDGFLDGAGHTVEIAYFYGDGQVRGSNTIDTALFYRNAIVEGNNTIDTCIVYNKAFIDENNSFRTATLLGDGIFTGENTFGTLTLSRSSTYLLENGRTQTVVDKLNVDGACTGPIIIQSDENQSQATIRKVNGTVEASYVSLRDIRGEGPGIPFTATNSVDLGNNSNWQVLTSSSKELYWVGGQGVWSDSLHWSGSSGGQGGYCIPSPIDNVYFDANSFAGQRDTVYIDIGNATCHNMSWEGAKFEPVFLSPDTNNLRIFGSLTLEAAMNLQLAGPVFFESTHGGNTIASKGNNFLNKLFFQGIGGQWQLTDDLSADSTIYFSNGEIITGGNALDCWSFNSDFTNSRRFHFDGSIISLKGTGTEIWLVNGLNLELSAANSRIVFKSPNAIFRTAFGGPFVFNNILSEGDRTRIYNLNTDIEFNNIHFLGSGQVHGDCRIDSVTFDSSGSVYDRDRINYLRVKGRLAYVDGAHNVGSAHFGQHAQIIGTNTLDSVLVTATALISGNNSIENYLQVGSAAVIEGSNTIEEALLLGNGILSGPNAFGVLSFSPGNKYELEEGITQTISSTFNIRGNNCFPIVFRSQDDGSEAFVSMPSGAIVSGDFIEMRDIHATGGADFYAGAFSTDISNNAGWNFNNLPGYIFGFPPDTTMCEGHELIVGTENFNPDENSAFRWQDGSNLPYFNVNNEDSLWVTVYYANDCSFTDTILINRSPSPVVDIGEDRSICEGDTLSILFSSDSLTYFWSDGSTDSVFIATQSGIVSLTATAPNGCYATDSVEITVRPAPDVFLGNDTTLRHDQTIVLDAGNSGSTYFWSTGDSTQSIVVSGAEGLVWVNVLLDGCVGNDSILLSEYPTCIIAVPNAFSPNGDGQNDMLYVRGSGFAEFELLIFNRIGEMVFRTTDESIGWDGTYKGKAQEVDAYMYIIKGRCIDGQDVMSKGNITLLR